MRMIRASHRCWYAAAALAVTAVFAQPCHAQKVQSLDSLLESVRQAEHVPAIAAAVMRGDRIIASGAVGVMEEGKDERVTVASRFHIGSCTKAVTATMLGQLIHNGDLNWNTTVIEILPELKGKIDPACESITVRHLLTHTAGMPAYTHPTMEELELLNSLSGTPREQRRQFLEKILANPPLSTPGTKMEYSNAGYAIVAALAEARTDMPWETLIQRRVFAPLGMTAAGTGWPRDKQHPHEPVGHWRRNGVPVPQTEEENYHLGPVLAPAGDVHCTINELGRFAGFHLEGLHGRNTPFMDAHIVVTLHAPLLDNYACGWAQRQIAGRPVEWHNGSAGTFFTWMTVDDAHDVAVVVATNCGDSEHACQVVTEKLLEIYSIGMGPRQPTMEPPPPPPAGESGAAGANGSTKTAP